MSVRCLQFLRLFPITDRESNAFEIVFEPVLWADIFLNFLEHVTCISNFLVVSICLYSDTCKYDSYENETMRYLKIYINAAKKSCFDTMAGSDRSIPISYWKPVKKYFISFHQMYFIWRVLTDWKCTRISLPAEVDLPARLPSIIYNLIPRAKIKPRVLITIFEAPIYIYI